MLGRICWTQQRRISLDTEQIATVPVRKLSLPDKTRGVERRIKKAARLLVGEPVVRVLTPEGFDHWDLLKQWGLHPVDTEAFRVALTPLWAVQALGDRDIFPAHATVCLRGGRESYSMERAARALCPLVRNLVIDVPGERVLPLLLRRDYGLPVLPPGGEEADLTLDFSPGPELTGYQFFWKEGVLPEDCERLPLLCALWEIGKLNVSEIGLRKIDCS